MARNLRSFKAFQLLERIGVSGGEFPRGAGDCALDTQQEEVVQLVWEAHADWVQAYNLFACSAEPEMAEYAIQVLQATETRYQYLLRQAREQQVAAYDAHFI